MKYNIMSVITINKVQNDYKVPIYNENQINVKQLLKYFWDGYSFNFNEYQQYKLFNSVHIKQVFLNNKKQPKIKKIKIERNINNNNNKNDNDSFYNNLSIILSNTNNECDDIQNWKKWIVNHAKKSD